MFEFFRGWKRKVGCVTLAFACVFAAGWVRSFYVTDQFSFRKTPRISHHVYSTCSLLAWKKVTITRGSNFLTFSFHHAASANDDRFNFFRGTTPEWKWHSQYLGFEFGKFRPNGPPFEEEIWIIPYWSILLPLTALTTWLLLSKPRTKRQSPITPASENPK